MEAAQAISEFVQGKTFVDYSSSRMLRYAVERAFSIIGEALNVLSKAYPETAAGIRNRERIIAFRNILVHGYAVVDDRVVWDIVQVDLPELRREVAVLLRESDESAG